MTDLKALHEAATPAPWEVWPEWDDCDSRTHYEVGSQQCTQVSSTAAAANRYRDIAAATAAIANRNWKADAALIVALRNAYAEGRLWSRSGDAGSVRTRATSADTPTMRNTSGIRCAPTTTAPASSRRRPTMTLADDERLVRAACSAYGDEGFDALDRILTQLHAYEKEHEAYAQYRYEAWVSDEHDSAHDEAEALRKEMGE